MSEALTRWEELVFDIVKEVWNTYYLENGIRLRGRTILKKLLMKKESEEHFQFNAEFQNIFNAITPPHLKGKPGPPLTPTEIKEAARTGRPVKVIDSHEDWNIYLVPDIGITLRVKLTVIEIYQIPERYNKYGDPLFVIQSTNVIIPMKTTRP